MGFKITYRLVLLIWCTLFILLNYLSSNPIEVIARSLSMMTLLGAIALIRFDKEK